VIRRRIRAGWGLLAAASVGVLAGIQVPVSASGQRDSFIQELVEHVAALAPLVESELARAFLNAAPSLPPVSRMLYREPETRQTITAEERAALPEEDQEKFVERPIASRFFYCTSYGTPLIYARPLDVLSRHGIQTLKGCKVMDFGYGMIGQGRIMAMLGADVHGVDVDSLLQALYSHPDDTGPVFGPEGVEGKLTLHHGQWPADAELVRAVGGDFDVILTKNVLKRGYIHPAREVDPSRLVHLGVDDEAFLAAVKQALKPGGVLLVYNISPKQNPEDKPYLPHADGEFPFARDLVEQLGLEVLAWDEQDDEVMRKLFAAVGYDQGKGVESLAQTVFTHVTVLRKP
jgi:hypothetical protein